MVNAQQGCNTICSCCCIMLQMCLPRIALVAGTHWNSPCLQSCQAMAVGAPGWVLTQRVGERHNASLVLHFKCYRGLKKYFPKALFHSIQDAKVLFMGGFPLSLSIFTYYLNPSQILLQKMNLSTFGPSPGMNCAWYVETVGKFPSAIFEV